MNQAALSRRYLAGELTQQPLDGEIELSRREQVPRLDQLPAGRRDELRARGIAPLRAARVACSVLAAGASSRMNLQHLPPEAAALLQRGGVTELPGSKALVPVSAVGDAVYNYLDLFLTNVRRFRQQAGVQLPMVVFVSEINEREILAHLQEREVEDCLVFRQPLEPQMVARPDDVQRARAHFSEEAYPQALEYSQQAAGQVLSQRKPAGHGEFLHQIVASGTLGRLLERGVEFLSVRNIDNVPAVFDTDWVESLGYLIEQGGDLLVEVSQRPAGQKGGALIRRNGRWQLAEDPAFHSTPLNATDSYYINNAVAIMKVDYLLRIYRTSTEELAEISGSVPQSERDARWREIAERGKQRFPMLVDAKPLTLDDGRVIAAVTPETNLWESTGTDPGLQVVPLAVDSDRDAGALLELAADAQQQAALRVRFSPTKNWADYAEPRKQRITDLISARVVAGRLWNGTASSQCGDAADGN